MSLYAIYFSPTGVTKIVLDQLAQAWGESPINIDLSAPNHNFSTYSFNKQDVCLIAAPSFGGRVPEVVIRHLSYLHGSNALAVLIVTYGNRAYDDTLLELHDAVTACSFRVFGAVAAVTEHSIMPQYGAGRPDMHDCEELAIFSEKLKKVSEIAMDKSPSLSLPGNHPFRTYGGVPLKPKASGACTGCGLCAKSCPVAAIPVKNPKKTDDQTCISCMRCIKVCPVKARSNSKIMLFIAGQKLKKACTTRKKNELFLEAKST